jgi:hypothetical protein
METLIALRRSLDDRKHPQSRAKSRTDFIHALLNHNDLLTIR